MKLDVHDPAPMMHNRRLDFDGVVSHEQHRGIGAGIGGKLTLSRALCCLAQSWLVPHH